MSNFVFWKHIRNLFIFNLTCIIIISILILIELFSKSNVLLILLWKHAVLPLVKVLNFLMLILLRLLHNFLLIKDLIVILNLIWFLITELEIHLALNQLSFILLMSNVFISNRLDSLMLYTFWLIIVLYYSLFRELLLILFNTIIIWIKQLLAALVTSRLFILCILMLWLARVYLIVLINHISILEILINDNLWTAININRGVVTYYIITIHWGALW